MTEPQLARQLIQVGLVTNQQVRHAAETRRAGIGIAQALVESGATTAQAIQQVEPAAFTILPQNVQAQGIQSQGLQAQGASTNGATDNGSAVNGAVAHGAAVHAAAANGAGTSLQTVEAHDAVLDAETTNANVGLGTGGAVIMDESGVTFDGEARGGDLDDPIMGTIVTYCNELLKIAVGLRASDMHLEPREHGLLPRYRVDGHLRSGGLIPKELQAPIVSRFKVLSNLDITENRLPQDGRFRATIGGHVFDFRVSSLPSIHGEKIVMRLLDRSALVTDLAQLGFAGKTRAHFMEMLSRSHGIILVTGPTGSGKTTTLYAALAAARDETKNVITVEDPVEYELEGVTQTAVQSDIDLTFAVQLRAILRQDPDVILVGEIRDGETAEIAIRAALTGHLVLSTLHTNSAVGAVTRLQDMGVAPFLLASSVAGVLAQRLARLICRGCKQPLDQDSEEYKDAVIRLRVPPGTPMFKGAGCELCSGTGYKGRLAIIELLSIDSEFRRAVMARDDSDTMRRIAISGGMKTLWEDGIEKMTHGLTTAEEIGRVLLGSQEED